MIKCILNFMKIDTVNIQITLPLIMLLKSENLNPLTANFTKWLIALKEFVGKLWTNCQSVFDHFVGLALKELNFPTY